MSSHTEQADSPRISNIRRAGKLTFSKGLRGTATIQTAHFAMLLPPHSCAVRLLEYELSPSCPPRSTKLYFTQVAITAQEKSFTIKAVMAQVGKIRDVYSKGTLSQYLQDSLGYQTTNQESLPLEIEVAVDPEMLGKVYESLINEEDRHQSGIFYTPRIEIDYMCRLSLIEYLHEATGSSKDMLIPSVMAQLYSAMAERSGRHENEFALKKRIVSQNLYGVDVKDWAVRVCELRLWLSLIIESEESQMDIYNQSLLPNLTFKARQGDSLVEELAGMPLSLRADYPYIPSSLKQRIRHIVDKKADYFRGDRSVGCHDIEHLEHELLTEVLDNKIKAINSDIRALESSQRQAFQTVWNKFVALSLKLRRL
jgi:hypothetical protein